ncbi:MAG: CDP-glycerol glycerophosphotransferase family protein [Globicatella sulfidifaciens]|uniref:CDP-glycerol glycerophosphotransferase family protein n=2 Tax=Globicatella sulfidifaciens TaxID=136093 RepID=A0A7X8C4R7_9LACT|nr:CDP-glycerol glycerophosphotransferase family protein [Globicatella sulfidifaciens]
MNALRLIAPRLYRITFIILSILPKDNKMIVFESFLGKQYSDNPKALYLYIKEKYPDYKLYWSLNREVIPSFAHEDIQVIKRLSLKWILVMSRAKHWITNTRLPLWIPKSNETVYLQTWHGTPLKKLGIDIEEVRMPGTTTENYKRNFVNEAKKWDYLVSPNSYSTNIFKGAFQFSGEIIESGYPRNDALNKKLISREDLLKSLNLPLDKKIILYAPTWRDNQYHAKGEYKFNLELDLKALEQELGDNYIVLLRTHYLIADQIDIENYSGFVYDFSTHNDISDLYLVSDILITDYSSVFFDYAVLRRPILFFVYDIKEYRDDIRGFYFDLEKYAPGPLLENNEQLLSALKRLNVDTFEPGPKYEDFIRTYCSLEDGNAAKRVVETLLER